MIVQQMTFDYGALDVDTRAFVQEKAQAIHARLKRTAEDIIAIGQDLIEVNEKLAPHHRFHAWLRAEFDMARRTAYRFMAVARKFGNCAIMAQFPPTALYDLLDVPDEIIEQVESGQISQTIEDIREAIKQAEKYVDPASLPVLEPEPGPIYGPVYQPSVSTLRLPNTYEGVSTVITPVEIDRVVHDEDPLEGETEEDRYMRAVDTGTTEYYHDDLRREAFHKDEEERASKRDAHVMRVMGSSDSPEWYTPQEIVRLSIELLGEIDLDPCSNSRETPNVPATNHYTKEDDGLLQPWKKKVYLNPPYGSEIPQWVEKLVNSYGHGVTEAIALLPARIDTIWFQPLYGFPMCNVRGRIQYENSPYHAPFPCVIVYLGERIDDFIKIFGHKGPIMKKVGGK